jgi:hypothetical protein
VHALAVDELFALPPERFSRARDEWVARLRAAGRAQEARQVAALRRPTLAVWALNQAARRGLGRAYLDALASLRAAQDALVEGREDVEAFRAAAGEERRALGKLVEAAEDALRRHGHAAGTPVARKVEAEARRAASRSPGALRVGHLDGAPARDGEEPGVVAAAAAAARTRRAEPGQRRGGDGTGPRARARAQRMAELARARRPGEARARRDAEARERRQADEARARARALAQDADARQRQADELERRARALRDEARGLDRAAADRRREATGLRRQARAAQARAAQARPAQARPAGADD